MFLDELYQNNSEKNKQNNRIDILIEKYTRILAILQE